MNTTINISELQERIKELEEEKKHLLKMVSHDIKSPYNKLFALSNLLQLTADNLGEEQRDYLLRMDWVIKEGLTVVRNLMDLRAIEANQIELNPEELNLNNILNECINGYQKQISVKKLNFNVFDDKVTAQSDKRYVDRIVDNLISNAIKFSPLNSKISIDITDNKAQWIIKVSTESGPIPEVEISRLFNKHSPLSTRPTHGENALGNGLYIAQNFAQRLGGKIEFDQENNLVAFSFYLPKKL